tara:strand:+ start:2071 stop:2553 length:483 start_codon:yes stop_codon:yes gene_type:complete
MSWKDIIKYKPIKVTGPYKKGDYKGKNSEKNSTFTEMFYEGLMISRTGETHVERNQRLEALNQLFPNGSLLIAGGKYETWEEFNRALDKGEIDRNIDIPMEALLRLRSDRSKIKEADPTSLESRLKRKRAELENADENLSQRQRREIQGEINRLEQLLKR